MKEGEKHRIKPDDNYLGIPRKDIAWYPAIDCDKCDDFRICVDFCQLRTYTYNDYKVRVSDPYNCIFVGNGCENKYPNEAISFPSTKVIDIIRKKYKA